MKYCQKCGKELLDEAVICPECGTSTGVEEQLEVQPKKKLNIKMIIGIAAAVVVLVVGIFVGLKIRDNHRREEVKEQLAGNLYSHLDYSYYSASLCYYEFDDNANCTYYYYYPSVMEDGTEYRKTYEIEFDDGKVYLVFLTETLEVRYDRYGEIEGLYDINTKKLYD